MKTRNKKVEESTKKTLPNFVGLFFPEDKTTSPVIIVSAAIKAKKLKFLNDNEVQYKDGGVWYKGEVIVTGGKLYSTLYSS